jgi:colanic acid/amylovoran biosynthesis protein
VSELIHAAKQAVVRSLMHSRVVCRRASAEHRPGTVLLLPPSNQGNLGDEAMIAATLDTLPSRGVNHVTILSYGPWPHWTRFGSRRAGLTLDYRCLYRVADKLRFVDLALEHEAFILLGADVIDGAYARQRTLLRIACVQLAAEAGCMTSIIGFSMREHPAAWALEELRKLPRSVRLRARDPFSSERCSRHLGRPVELTADPAFLLKPELVSEPAQQAAAWVGQQRRLSRAVVGLNANGSTEPEMREAMVKAYKTTIEGFIQAGHDAAFLFLPHDYRGARNDVTLAERVIAAIDPLHHDRIAIARDATAAEIKHLAGLVDITLAGRAQVAIASLGQGTPAVGIAHHGDFEGLYAPFALEDVTIPPKKAAEGTNLLHFFAGAFDHRDPLRKRLTARLDNVRALALANFAP